jgi:hypothetical protein
MGLLDDAIREHLELKRQHGADPTEVEQQEREALGAQQRAEFAATPGEPGDEPPVEVGEPAPPEEPPAAEETQVLEDRDELPADEPAGVAEVPEPGQEAAAPGYDEDPWLDEEPDEVPAEESLSRPEPAAPPQGEEEDVLEETPEFLQETPEHERLWFEQRPPRDFDWDK